MVVSSNKWSEVCQCVTVDDASCSHDALDGASCSHHLCLCKYFAPHLCPAQTVEHLRLDMAILYGNLHVKNGSYSNLLTGLDSKGPSHPGTTLIVCFC